MPWSEVGHTHVAELFFFFNISHQENLKLMKLNLKLKLNKIVSKQMKNRAGGFYSYLKKKNIIALRVKAVV